MGRPLFRSAAVAFALAASATACTRESDTGLRCSEHVVPVRMAATGPADQRIAGTLCYRGEQPPDTVQLLVHGATYDRTYWDPPLRGAPKSYMRAATARGYATFAVDRLGAGYSSHPEPGRLDATAGAVALHDVVSALRAGRISGTGFDAVVWVGHSLGAAIGWLEVARYRDVDALVVTSEMHRINPAGWNALAVILAETDARWAGTGLDGYLTTSTGARGLFYNRSDALAETIAWDNAERDVSAPAELAEARALVDSADPATAPSRLIDVPVLVAVGTADPFWCGPGGLDCADPDAVARYERGYYPAASRLDVVTLPGVGHSVALHESAPATARLILDWIDTAPRPSCRGRS